MVNDLETMVVLIAAKKNVVDYLWVVLSILQNGWSPLMAASQHGHHVVKLLIKQGANLNCQNKVSMTVDKVAA